MIMDILTWLRHAISVQYGELALFILIGFAIGVASARKKDK